MDFKTRKILLGSLLCTFLIQTSLVYFDESGQKTPPLSRSAQEGQEIWHSHNCQSCHQIYGFGGFLGPDLTNAVKRLTPPRLTSILTDGSAQMPAYHFSTSQQEALLSFFKELDSTGNSVPHIDNGRGADPVLHFYASAKELMRHDKNSVSPNLNHGFETVQNYACISCHLPNTKSLYQAPDLTMLTQLKTKEEIAKVLVEGRIEKGMPPFQMAEAEREAVIAFLSYINVNRDEFLNIYHPSRRISMFEFLKKLPWFTYE